MATLGSTGVADQDLGWAGWGLPCDKAAKFWICPQFDGAPPLPGNGVMTAFRARSAGQVCNVHAAALAHGGQDEGAPNIRPQYKPDFYVAHVRNPDGNKLACTFPPYNPADDR